MIVENRHSRSKIRGN